MTPPFSIIKVPPGVPPGAPNDAVEAKPTDTVTLEPTVLVFPAPVIRKGEVVPVIVCGAGAESVKPAFENVTDVTLIGEPTVTAYKPSAPPKTAELPSVHATLPVPVFQTVFAAFVSHVPLAGLIRPPLLVFPLSHVKVTAVAAWSVMRNRNNPKRAARQLRLMWCKPWARTVTLTDRPA